MEGREASLPVGLYVVATPIGNLGDMTARARETLLGNLYKDTEGRFWSSTAGEYTEMERTNSGEWEFTTTTKRDVGEGWIKAEFEHDWAWYVPRAKYGIRTGDTYEYYEACLLDNRRGLILAEVLLSHKEEIEEWALEYANSRPDRPKRDWEDFCNRFFPFRKEGRLDISDCGPLLCYLHTCLDEIQGVPPRNWAY